MWDCAKCGEEVEDGFEVCWNCGAAENGSAAPQSHGFEQAKESIADVETAWANARIDYRKAVSFEGEAEKALAAARSLFIPPDFTVVSETDTYLQLKGPGHSARTFSEGCFSQISRLRIRSGGGELSMEAELEGTKRDTVFFRIMGFFLIAAGLVNFGRNGDTGTILAGTIILVIVGVFLVAVGRSMRQANDVSRELDEALEKIISEARR